MRTGAAAPGTRLTLAGFKQKVAGFKAIFPDLEEDLQDIMASGDTVATRWVVTGSQQQEFLGIRPPARSPASPCARRSGNSMIVSCQ
jgi:predicted ester cyclase